jgi:Tol biopolymer transport system component
MKLIVAAVVTAVLLGGAASYGAFAFASSTGATTGDSAVRARAAVASGPRIVFRSTQPGDGYGLVGSVPLADPSGPRTMTDVACDRVYSTGTVSMCLRIDRGVLTTFSANLLDANGKTTKTWPLPGIPSRTRISADSSLVAFTSFVTGAAYATVGFSTSTHIATASGKDLGSLEDFSLLIDGDRTTAADRNFWGVTFGPDDNLFYATAASGGTTWLVRGDLAKRTLTAIRQIAECPSLSPDGTRIAYKKNVSSGANAHWAIAVLDLSSNRETILPERRTMDDQVEWLNDDTLLYGLPHDGTVGDSDVWSIDSDGSTPPTLFIEHAWSPSVVTR